MAYWYDNAGNFIGGRWVDGGPRRDALSPATGAAIGSIAWSTRETVQDAIAAAREAQTRWARTPIWERAAMCHRIADAIDARREAFAALVSHEQGKPLAQAVGEVTTAATGFRLAAEEVKFLEGQTIPTRDPRKKVLTFHQPRGVYAVVTPWNFPVNIPVEYLGPGIATGNTIVWVPAPTTSLCAVELMRIMDGAGLPAGVVNLVTGEGATAGDEAVSNPGTDAIGFTGSAATGKRIAERGAGKPMLLEMGGNGPMIVLHDADVEAAAAAAAFGCFFNAGQVCSAAERLLVHERVHDQFAERMVEHAKAVVLGNPLDPATTMGPLNNPAVARKTAEHVADAVDRGAALRHGGFAPQDLGSALYYAPTVLTGVTEDSDIAREETFGPVAPILKVASDDEALRIAKDNRYGLVGAVFTRDLARAFRFIEELPVGIVNVNETTNYWELQIPFGGKSGKDSGIGRLGGRHTLLAMTDIKTATLNVG